MLRQLGDGSVALDGSQSHLHLEGRRGPAGVVCSWLLLFTAIIAVVRQKFHVSFYPDIRSSAILPERSPTSALRAVNRPPSISTSFISHVGSKHRHRSIQEQILVYFRTALSRASEVAAVLTGY